MTPFLKKDLRENKFELLIDASIFPVKIILKASYLFLDLGYFFFKKDADENIILQFTPKDGIDEKPETIIGNFSDELLNTYLRDRLEKENKKIREAIVKAAIGNSIDAKNHVTINTDMGGKNSPAPIDFDKDIDEILKEIENDPDLKIDEAEIEKILKEIEEETQPKAKQAPILDPKKANDAKKKFQNRK